jgi:hypothetical protein
MALVAYKKYCNFIHKEEVCRHGDWERLVTGVVAGPENVDSYGGTISEEETRTAMLRFMEEFQNTGLGHIKDSANNPVLFNDVIRVVECWQTRVEQNIGGVRVPKGSWVMTVRVLDNDIWAGILDGTYTGFSFEAFANKVPIHAAA